MAECGVARVCAARAGSLVREADAQHELLPR